jgi:hypothetical protein
MVEQTEPILDKRGSMLADEQVLCVVRTRVQKAESDQKCEGKKIGWELGLSGLK